MADNISVYSATWDPFDSYGVLSCNMAWHLEQLGKRVAAFGHCLDHPKHSEAIRSIIQKPVVPSVGGLLLGYPTLLEKAGPMLSAGPVLSVTMFESTKLPEGWADALNKMHGVIVPSKFLIDIFRENGVEAPIHVVPLGISSTYKLVARPEGRRPFTFLVFGDRGLRKGWDLAARAFNVAFGKDPNFQLVIKTREHGGLHVEINHPNITILRRDLSEKEMLALYASTDCLLWPSRGEGFALPPREYAATGGPVIATNWSGSADDIHIWGYPLRYEMIDAWMADPSFSGKGYGQWAEPEFDHLVWQMKFVVEHQRTVRARMMGAAQKVKELYSWRKFAEQVALIWSWNTSQSGSRKARLRKEGLIWQPKKS